MSVVGLGGSLTFSIDINLDFNLGINVGIYNFSDKDEMTEYLRLVPFMLSLGYKIDIINQLTIMPELSGGGAYVMINRGNGTKSGVESIAKAGVTFEYTFYRGFSAQLVVGYGLLIEKDEPMQFLSLNLGVGYRL
ncbi:hypothetical protein ACFL20_12885 [Spirochaetota bacterium]